MAPDKEIKLELPSILGYEKVAMDSVASVARTMGFSPAQVEDLKTAVSEACLNAIDHGNKLNASMKVGVVLTMEKSKLQVTVRDEGRGIGSVGVPSIEDKVEGRDEPRGWGTFLIKSLMDEVEFEDTPEGGNLVRMVIHLKK